MSNCTACGDELTDEDYAPYCSKYCSNHSEEQIEKRKATVKRAMQEPLKCDLCGGGLGFWQDYKPFCSKACKEKAERIKRECDEEKYEEDYRKKLGR